MVVRAWAARARAIIAAAPGRIIWGSDYPHYEGTFPHSRLAMRHSLHEKPESEVRAILDSGSAQVVASGRQRVVKLAVKAEWWNVLKACYERLRTWLAATAPQLEAQGNFLRQLARQTTDDPLEWLAQPPPNPSG